ncbi:MAG: hypothetical protein ABSH39_09045 [Candidatus Acidiferrum sp.]|jgi:hypothetical protein
MKKIAALALSLFLTVGTALADTPKDADAQPAKPAPAKPKAAKKADKSDAAIAAELEELRQALQAQQEQLTLLKEELAKRDRQIDEARDAAAAANARAAEAATKASEAANTTAEVKSNEATLNSTVADLKASNEALKTTVATEAAATTAAKANPPNEDGPASLSYKGITITPGGFVEAATAFRTHATGDDINTQFSGIPYPNNALSQVTENVFSARQSRLSLLMETHIGGAKVNGYVEADFLGTGVTSNNRQSNSYVLRYRQFWGRVAFDNGFAFTGGQMWSLVTESKKGIENRQEAFPMMIDPQYVVGWAWQRADSLRITKGFADGKFTLAAALEGPQTTYTAHGTGLNFFFNTPGAGGGLTNFIDTTGYTANKSPDFLVKAAVDPGWGHFEVVGIVSPFRDRVYPCGAVPVIVADLPATCNGSGTSVAGAYNNGRVGGGFGATARLPVVEKKADVVLHFQGGDGIGRYSSAQLSDVTARPDGTLAPIRSAAWLGQLELHPSPKFDLYAYYGGEYAARTNFTYINADGFPVGVGYGSPLFNDSGCTTEGFPSSTATNSSPTAPASAGTCTGDVHTIVEGTLGFWHNIYSGNKGRLRWGIQYSYITKLGWSGDDASATTGLIGVSQRPKAVENMVLTSFRYYIP